ncbi:MAG: hypothetical protein LUD51_02740 [Clostridia bacterium]|nr:hypothetical protein [Clostridia bacterium]
MYRFLIDPKLYTEEPTGIPCKVCGAMIYSFIKGSSCGSVCHKCGWKIVTTYIEPIIMDEGPYTLQLDAIPEPTIDNIRVAAKLVNCGYMEAKSRLQKGEISKTGEALEIAEAAQDLKDAGYSFSITPDFPYPY